ncbi:hypothetical protein [Mucilaginibacter jinjuensis]|uniref:PH (Pleckstrin Homology) domain-containing protein n=1 Tax=Mucilaginibacter jinjuensis TaxID=1176721 RepID=A0ABY7T7V9_9SPHI|nr:hypothetical protein [Mucilaginibacter jinjuensis]WCT12496.1 hypothetical protein PQO05_00945 [Mucilaginibacter jinjuensis]
MEIYEDYISNGNTLRYCFIVTILLLDGTFLWLFPVNNVFYLIALTIFIFWLKPWHYKVSSAVINDSMLTITKYNFLMGSSKRYSFDVQKIDFIYRDRPIKFHRGGGFGSNNRGNVLTVYFDTHPLFDLTPDEDGWSHEAINKLSRYLKANEIKQVVDKFGENDVVL